MQLSAFRLHHRVHRLCPQLRDLQELIQQQILCAEVLCSTPLEWDVCMHGHHHVTNCGGEVEMGKAENLIMQPVN